VAWSLHSAQLLPPPPPLPPLAAPHTPTYTPAPVPAGVPAPSPPSEASTALPAGGLSPPTSLGRLAGRPAGGAGASSHSPSSPPRSMLPLAEGLVAAGPAGGDTGAPCALQSVGEARGRGGVRGGAPGARRCWGEGQPLNRGAQLLPGVPAPVPGAGAPVEVDLLKVVQLLRVDLAHLEAAAGQAGGDAQGVAHVAPLAARDDSLQPTKARDLRTGGSVPAASCSPARPPAACRTKQSPQLHTLRETWQHRAQPRP